MSAKFHINKMGKPLLISMISTILFASSATATANNRLPRPKIFKAGGALQITDLPNGNFRQRLSSLPAHAQQRALKRLRRFTFSERDLPHLKTDNAGDIYYADTFIPTFAPQSALSATPAPVLPTVTATEAFALHSKPGSSKVVYLDFNGHTISGTAWNSSNTSLNALPYDTDGYPSSFSDTELGSIAEIWRRIAEDFAPFDIDVTTEEPATFTANTGRLLITKDTDADGKAMPAQGAGGVAYVGVWGESYYSYYSPALVYYNRLGGGRADYVTEAASHELGHNLGLSHDATTTLGYYGGHGTGYISWGPIMGTGYNRHVSQWSKGEYTDANNDEDDISIIASKLTTRPDDHSNTYSGATAIVTDASGAITATTPINDPANGIPANKGIIQSRTDIDTFYFDTAGGAVTLQATPAWQTSNTRGVNLDIQLVLRDSNGSTVEESDKTNDTDATISTALAAGRYYLSVEGVGNLVTPYSDYGSLGQYFLSGSIPISSDDGTPDSFLFTDQTDVALSTEALSNTIMVSGINVDVPIAITGGEYSTDGGVSYSSTSATVSNGATVKVRHTSSADYATVTNTTLTIGDVSDTFSSTTLANPADTTPDAFSFTDKTGVNLASLIESDTVTVSGINSPSPVSVSGGEYRINGGAYTSAAGTVSNGDSLQVRHLSSSLSKTVTNSTLTIGGVSGTFNSTTATADTKPATFRFTAKNKVALSSNIESNTVTISGINAPTPISITTGEYRINGGNYTNAAGTVNNGDTIQLRHTSSANFVTTTTTVLKVGSVSRNFTSKTLAKDTKPNAFSFTRLNNVAKSTPLQSNVVTISGINAAAEISISNGEYRINDGAYTTATGSINNGDRVQARHTSSANGRTSVISIVTIGGVKGSFKSTTLR
ncbi:MAG: pre-peptidase C-terminal domain-containing protein [Gammaproteobacteria bacterium]|nr:pre-peptidase C-terminal domain-containing protein [Gammaproteobacteria bacterium]MBU1722884.1 pre-peptidase C-terminal domain-containing protein [Gammaproteobacteria bacterium]MBU2005739.1 pre-peptidase C-terminal domain-containing protein [Gammaproteobacteria bacterium]